MRIGLSAITATASIAAVSLATRGAWAAGQDDGGAPATDGSAPTELSVDDARRAPRSAPPKNDAPAAKDPGNGAADDADGDSVSGDEAEPDRPPAERRSGFMVGLVAAGAFGGASGYPNDASKIDREAYYTNTGVAFGGAGSFFIAGSITDWLSVGLGATGAVLAPTDQRVPIYMVELHLEGFPAWALGGQWREVGAYLKTGAGFATVDPSDGSDPVVATGGASRLGFGLFYEGIRAWQISMGPLIGGDFLWSASGVVPMGLVGWRTALYTGP